MALFNLMLELIVNQVYTFGTSDVFFYLVVILLFRWLFHFVRFRFWRLG